MDRFLTGALNPEGTCAALFIGGGSERDEAMADRRIPSVALVDRDATACMLMREICLSSGWRVVGGVQDVNDAMMLLARERPDCLITGYRFNGRASGLHLIHHARRLLPRLFTILYTGWDINDVAANIGTSQPDRILRKPMPPHLLVDLLDGVQSRVIHREARRSRTERTIALHADSGR